MAAYFYAKVDSGKDSAFKKFESPCSQCTNGVKLKDGVRLKGAGRKKAQTVYTEEDLFSLYQKFEADRVTKSEKQLGGGIKLKPDSFGKFVVDRTDICPHQLINNNSSYWIDTVLLLDNEMGLGLPGPLGETPAIFFDCLGIVRSMRSKARKEETKA